MLAQITLTPAESKRLIAKAVVALPEVRRALKKGIVVVGFGSTNAHVVEELTGTPIERNRYVAGIILPIGTCTLPREKRLNNLILVCGKPVRKPLREVLDELGPEDVVIKGANALDPQGNAGVLLASRTGGTVGEIVGYVKSRGAHLIIPVGLEKFVPSPLREISKQAGIFKMSDATGCPTGLVVLDGKVVTEIEAVKILSGAEAWTMAAGGISGAEGSITLLVSGRAVQIRRLMKLVREIKGIKDPPVKTDCAGCKNPDCFYSGHSS